MTLGLSRAASHDGRSTEAGGAGATPPGTVELGFDVPRPKGHVPAVLRLLRLLTLALVTIVVAGIASPPRDTASLAGSIAVAAHDSANAVQRALAPQPAHHRRPPVTQPVAGLEAEEADLDDDRDALYEVADDRAATFKGVWLARKPGRGLRVDPQIDTSRFAAGTGLPRGPPT